MVERGRNLLPCWNVLEYLLVSREIAAYAVFFLFYCFTTTTSSLGCISLQRVEYELDTAPRTAPWGLYVERIRANRVGSEEAWHQRRLLWKDGLGTDGFIKSMGMFGRYAFCSDIVIAPKAQQKRKENMPNRTIRLQHFIQ